MDQFDGRRNSGRSIGNPRQRPPQWNPRPNPNPPRPEPPRPPRPRPLPIPVPVENVIAVNNAIITDVDVTSQFSTITISYGVLNQFNQVVTQNISLVITNETQIENQFGQSIGAWGLRVGMVVNTRFSSRFTRSIPPQAVAFFIRIVRFA